MRLGGVLWPLIANLFWPIVNSHRGRTQLQRCGWEGNAARAGEVSRFEAINDIDSDRSPEDSARLEEAISLVKFAKYNVLRAYSS